MVIVERTIQSGPLAPELLRTSVGAPVAPPPRLLMGPGPDHRRPPGPARDVRPARRPVRPGHDGVHERDPGPLPRGVPHRQRGDRARRRHLARGHRGRSRLADLPRGPGARPRLRPVRAPAARDRRTLRRRGPRPRGPLGRGVSPRGPRGGRPRGPPEARRARPGRHLHHHEPAPRGRRRDVPPPRRAALRRLHRLPRREPVRDGRVGDRRRHRRAAEVPRRPVGQFPRLAVPARRRGGPRPAQRRGRVCAPTRGPSEDTVPAPRPHPLELLRPRDDPRLLGREAPQPPHRGHHHALRRARVRPPRAGGGAGGGDRPAPAARRRDARRGPRAGAGGVRRRRAQDAQRRRRRDPRGRGRRGRPRRRC